MAYIVQGETSAGGSFSGYTKDLGYKYPGSLDLRPSSDLHRKLVQRLIERASVARDTITPRFKSWQKIDETLTAFVVPTEKERNLKSKDDKKPITIVFPYSYAMLETLLTYLVGAFIQDPIFRFEGRGPEDVIGSIMMEAAVQYQCYRSKIGLALHTWFRDSLAYGIGAVAPLWERTYGMVLRKNMIDGAPIKHESTELIYEGNRVENIDPYCLLLDPNVSVHNYQKGEFFGWMAQDNLMNLLSTETSEPDSWFNVKYLKELKGRRSSFANGDDSARNKKSGASIKDSIDSNVTNRVDVMWMYVNLIPKDWGLGGGEDPERWMFTLAADAVILRAQPLGLIHNMYPACMIAPDFDGYSSVPLSRLEIMYGLQGCVDFLFNSHVENVRKAINDMLVYDPYLINGADLEDPKAGKLIRTRRPAWGRGVKDSVMQLNVNDVTKTHIGDVSWIVQYMERLGAVDSSMMGALRQGGPERLTSGEFQGTRGGSLSRLERVAKVIGMQGMQDLGVMLASHTQQLMEEEQMAMITGETQQRMMDELGVSGNRIKISPFDLLIGYDIIARDGSVSGGNFNPAMTQLFQTIATTPELQGQFDTFRIFAWIARSMGVKNISDFKRQQVQTQVMPDQRVMDQVQRGNLVPVNQMASSMPVQ
jgi:hypothetical protein